MPERTFDDFAKSFRDAEKSFYEPIGHFVFVFGRVENQIDRAVCDLMGIDYYQIGRYPLNELDFLSRVKLLRVFCRGMGEEIEKEMRTATDEMEELNAFRNNLVHGPWTAYTRPGPDEPSWQKPGLSRRFNSQFWNVKISEIRTNTKKAETLASQISEIAQRVELLRAAKSAAPSPSPDKSE